MDEIEQLINQFNTEQSRNGLGKHSKGIVTGTLIVSGALLLVGVTAALLPHDLTKAIPVASQSSEPINPVIPQQAFALIQPAEAATLPIKPQSIKGVRVRVPGGDLANLRSSPGLDSRAIAQLESGKIVQPIGGVVEVDGVRWQQVQHGNLTGWMCADFL